MRGGLSAVFCSFCLCSVPLWAAFRPPFVTWASYPAQPGAHVLVHGGEWGRAPRVEVRGRALETRVLSDTGLAFPYPCAEEEIVEGRIVNDRGSSQPFVLNAPTVWWLQGDEGDTSTPGGRLRIFGRSLAPKRAAQARVRVWLGERELALEKTDVYSLDARIADDMPPGEYRVTLHNALAGGRERYDAGVWRIAPRRQVWKTTRFDVRDHGAEPNDDVSDSEAFEAALAAASQNGGGIVYVPPGRYVLTRTLVLPPRVLLKGEDRALSQICWPDTMTPPDNLIEGTHSFGIHDLFISSGQYRNGIVAKTDLTFTGQVDASRGVATHDISLKRLRVKFVSDQWRDNRPEQFMARYGMRGDGIVIRNCLRAEIEDCDIYCDKDAQRTLFFSFTGDYIRMAHCRINGSGWALFGGDRCIFENNTANNCTYSISAVCRRMFWSGNRQTDLFTNNREAVTHDGAKTAFYARQRGRLGCAHAKVSERRVKLTYPDDIGWRTGTNFQAWVGCELQITDGRGAGQTRTITRMASYEDIEIDRPFDGEVDESSLYVIVAERKHLLYVDNDIEDAGVAIQLYGGVTDCIVARNRCRRAGGFHGSGRDYYGVITCWYVQFLDNVVEEGNCHRGNLGTDWKGAGSSLIGAFPPNVKWPFSQSYVYRGNEIKSNGSLFISVKNAVVEKNTVRLSDVGVSSRRYQDTLYVANNVFDRVQEPYRELGGAYVYPPYVDRTRENYLAQLKAGTFDLGRRQQVVRAFGCTFRARAWDINFRKAVAGRHREMFRLPVSLDVGGILREDVKTACVHIPSAGGWKFGERVVLRKEKDKFSFSGTLEITPPSQGPVGMFSWPVEVILTGEDWRAVLNVKANPLSENRFLLWEVALGEAGKRPVAWRKTEWLEGANGHERFFVDRLFPNGAHVGKDVHMRTRIKVVKPVRFSFRRGDWTSYLRLDGRDIIAPPVNTTTPIEATIGVGEHVLELVRPATSPYVRKAHEGMFLTCTFPDGADAGDWFFVK